MHKKNPVMYAFSLYSPLFPLLYSVNMLFFPAIVYIQFHDTINSMLFLGSREQVCLIFFCMFVFVY